MGDKRFKVGPSWVLDHKISQGSFGKVYKGQHATTGKPVAVKLEPLDVRHPQLPPEAEIYMCLQETHGVPRLYWHGHVDGRFDGIVLDLLGPDLDALYTYCGGFSLSTVILLGLQIIERVRGVHDAGFVYRDIKPQNFAIGLGETGLHTVHILDFGLAKATSVIAARGGSSGLVGTARYASISAHRGEPASFGNDLESVGYMMMYWLRGRLPWSGLKAKNSREKYEKILRKKLSIPLKDLCQGHPPEMVEFIAYCRGLRPQQMPDYDKLAGLLRKISRKRSIPLDGEMDWCVSQEGMDWPDPALPDMGKGSSVHPRHGQSGQGANQGAGANRAAPGATKSSKYLMRDDTAAAGASSGNGGDAKASGGGGRRVRRARSSVCVIL